MNEVVEINTIQDRIFNIRGKRVMLDSDLASLYGVETKRLNESVKRNIERFPEDFMFQLTEDEFKVSRCQIVTSKESEEEPQTLRSQFATSNKRGGRQYLPYVFTEHGVTMLASVLRSKKAIEINIQVVRAFIALRQFAIEQKDVTNRLDKLEEYLMNYCKDNEKDKEEIYKAIDTLMDRTKPMQIGFKT